MSPVTAKRNSDAKRGTDGRTFGERLMFLMDMRNMSQSDLAAKMEVGRATVNQWVLDYSMPGAYHILWLADFFSSDVRTLLMGPGSKPEKPETLEAPRVQRRKGGAPKDP